MASWIDFASLLITVVVCGGAIYGIMTIINLISKSLKSTKEQLKSHGLDVSRTGVSVRTSGRLDREDYVGATQRKFVQAMSSSTYTRAGASPKPIVNPLGQANHEPQAASQKSGWFGRK